MAPLADTSVTNLTFTLNQGNAVTPYTGPGPAAGEGPHRYGWLLFQQLTTFQASSNLAQPGTAPGHWNLTSYVSSSGLGHLVVASFFTVENGQASYQVPSTTAFVATTNSIPSTSSPAPFSSSSTTHIGAVDGIPDLGLVFGGLMAVGV